MEHYDWDVRVRKGGKLGEMVTSRSETVSSARLSFFGAIYVPGGAGSARLFSKDSNSRQRNVSADAGSDSGQHTGGKRERDLNFLSW